ncbi:uncharacterized protein LOC144477582 [Augochlora pura]
MKNIAERFKINQFRTTTFKPQSNGSIERLAHDVLTEYLKQYISKGDWDEWLPFATFSYNSSVHEGTLFIPHELVFGTIARTPSANASVHDSSDESYTRYLENLQTTISDTITKARENLGAAKLRSKSYYDRKVNVQTFSVGDSVFLLKEPRKGKFDDEYTGPYIVTECVGERNVKIRVKNGSRGVHADKLKHAPKIKTMVQKVTRSPFLVTDTISATRYTTAGVLWDRHQSTCNHNNIETSTPFVNRNSNRIRLQRVNAQHNDALGRR